MEPHEVLNALRDLVAAGEEEGWDTTEHKAVLDKGREAYSVTCEIFGDKPCQGQFERHAALDDGEPV